MIEACKKLNTDDRKRAFQARGAKLAEAHNQALEKMRADASYGWDASPISTARLSAELWGQIRTEDWALVTDTSPWIHDWPLQLWDFTKHYQYIGGAEESVMRRPPRPARRLHISGTDACQSRFSPMAT